MPLQLGLGRLVEVAAKLGEGLQLAEGRQVEINDEHLLPALKEGLLGMQPGEEKLVEVAFEEDHPNEELKGKTASFAIVAKELHEKLLPELDDEFAKDAGGHASLKELEEKVRANIRTSKYTLDLVVKALRNTAPVIVAFG